MRSPSTCTCLHFGQVLYPRWRLWAVLAHCQAMVPTPWGANNSETSGGHLGRYGAVCKAGPSSAEAQVPGPRSPVPGISPPPSPSEPASSLIRGPIPSHSGAPPAQGREQSPAGLRAPPRSAQCSGLHRSQEMLLTQSDPGVSMGLAHRARDCKEGHLSGVPCSASRHGCPPSPHCHFQLKGDRALGPLPGLPAPAPLSAEVPCASSV